MQLSKAERHRLIESVVSRMSLGTQFELLDALGDAGCAVTQATISRDLEQIGAVKARRDGQLIYTLPDAARNAFSPRIAAVFHDWVRSVEPAANLVVIKTPPGSAHLVGVALDNSDLAEIAGTICGDDTIFVACRSSGEAAALSAKLSGELA